MSDVPMASRALDTYIRTILSDGTGCFVLRALSVAESACENRGAISLFFGLPFRVDALRQVIRALMLAATKRSSAGVVMLRAALVVTSLIFGIEIDADSTALAGPPYQNCNDAHADGSYSTPPREPP